MENFFSIGFTVQKHGQLHTLWLSETVQKALGLEHDYAQLDFRKGASDGSPDCRVYAYREDGSSVSIAALWQDEDGFVGQIARERVGRDGKVYSNAKRLLEQLKVPKITCTLELIEDRWVLYGYPESRPREPEFI